MEVIFKKQVSQLITVESCNRIIELIKSVCIKNENINVLDKYTLYNNCNGSFAIKINFIVVDYFNNPKYATIELDSLEKLKEIILKFGAIEDIVL